MQTMPASAPVATPSWWRLCVERWRALRDGLLIRPGFRRGAAAFPLTAPVARRRAGELFDLVAGFVYSQVLLACVQLRVFDLLAAGPLALDVLARRLALTDESTDRLVSAAVALRLLERRGHGRVGLGALGAPMVGNTAVAAMVEHHAALYADLRDPVALLRGEVGSAALARYWPYADAETPGALPAESVAAYSALMAASQPLVAEEILDAYAFGAHRCLLDVGGGEGGFLVSAGARHPALQLMLFDLPAVVARAEPRFAAAGMAGRARCVAGSFLSDPLPTGADIATLVRVLHDHDDATALQILRNVRQALPVDGTVVVAEPLAGTPGAERMGDAYFGFYLLAMGRGRPRTAEALGALLRAAGFDRVRQVPTRMPLQTSMMLARVPRV